MVLKLVILTTMLMFAFIFAMLKLVNKALGVNVLVEF